MFFWKLAIKKPLTAATVRGGANAKRSQYLKGYGHKYSDLLLIEQTKAKVNADFQIKRLKESKRPERV